MKKSILDVAIIGAGVSGVYSGWRLLTADKRRSDTLADLAADRDLKVTIFERSDRVGGRLLSLTPPEMPTIKAEFGGMRYLTNQPLMSKLIDKFDLPNKAFPVGSSDNIYYLRGQHFRQHQFADGVEEVPYRLSWLEKGKSPGKIIIDAIDTIIPGATRMSAIEWQQVKETFKFNGEYLYKLGFWNVLHQVMSSEAYKLLLDAGGYDTTLTNWNAAEAMPWFLADFGPEAEYRTVIEGMETVPLTIGKKFVEAGGTIEFDHQMDRFTKDDDGCYTIHFDNQKPVRARHIVLAMPRRSLELLNQEAPFFQQQTVRELVPTVTAHPLFKLFMCYRYPWWRDAGVSTGRSLTDLPVRQVYYFDSEPDPGQFEPEMMDSLLMASYDDGRFVGFWTGMAGEAQPLPFYSQKPQATRWQQHAAPPLMIKHAQRQLKLVHDLEYIPDPYAAAFINWGADPYGGGWNSWNIGVKAWEVQDAIRQPLKDWNVYVCGEAYSSSQGWAEGALETAEALLQDQFDLREPDWL